METEVQAITQNTSVEDAKKAASKEKRQAALKRAREAQRAKRLVAKAQTPVEVAPAAIIKDSEIIWFTEVDMNQKGGVASDFPAYYFDTKELKEDIRGLTEQLSDGIFQGKRKREAEKRLSTLADKLDKIEKGRPNLQGPVKDKVVKSLRCLEQQIGDSMFSYDSHWKQTADPHVVAERMVNPCIEIKDETTASFAKQRGMKIENGKINQTDASIIMKVMAKLVGEASDTDKLRPIRAHGTTI